MRIGSTNLAGPPRKARATGGPYAEGMVLRSARRQYAVIAASRIETPTAAHEGQPYEWRLVLGPIDLGTADALVANGAPDIEWRWHSRGRR